MKIFLLSAIAIFSLQANSTLAGETRALLGPSGISILGQPHIPFERNVEVAIANNKGGNIIQETFSVKSEFAQSIGKCQTVDFVIVEKINFAELDSFKIMLVSSKGSGHSICHVIDEGINISGGDGTTLSILAGNYSKKYHNRPLAWVGGRERDDFTDKETISFNTMSVDGIKEAELRITCDEGSIELSIEWGNVTPGIGAGSLIDVEHRVGKNPSIQSGWQVTEDRKGAIFLGDASSIMSENADFMIARRALESKNGEKAVFELSGSDYILEYLISECEM